MQIISERKRFNVAACGRRFGKSLLGQDLSADVALEGYPAGWFSPTYKMLLEIWREMAQDLQPFIKRRSVQERRLELITGGIVEFWSLDNPDAARGRRYARVIVDEAGMVPDLMDAWQYVIRPTLIDYQGDGWFFGTPKGHNGFWNMFQWGQDEQQNEWQSWRMPSAANPFLPQAEIDGMRETMPERVFQQEIMAAFIEDAGGVFRGVMAAATAQEQSEALPGHAYIFGVDWGKSADFTCITVIDVRLNALVYLDRFNQIDYTLQTGRLGALYDRFRPHAIIAEQNSMGDPLIEQLQRQGLPVQPFTTTNATKKLTIEALALAFERQQITIINDPVLVGELQAFEMERLPSGTFRYSAPAGMHDDTVISLALAWHGASIPPAAGATGQEPNTDIYKSQRRSKLWQR